MREASSLAQGEIGGTRKSARINRKSRGEGARQADRRSREPGEQSLRPGRSQLAPNPAIPALPSHVAIGPLTAKASARQPKADRHGGPLMGSEGGGVREPQRSAEAVGVMGNIAGSLFL